MVKFSSSVPVLVRSAGDEPRRLWAHGSKGTYVVVGTEDGEFTIGFPEALVYRFEPEVYERLSEAFSADDRDSLGEAWRDADRWTGHE